MAKITQAAGLQNPLQNVFPVPIQAKRAPTSNDLNYELGQIWVDTVGTDAYILINVQNGAATWNEIAVDAGSVDELTGDSGGPITPVSGNISLLGVLNEIVTTGTAGTITFSIPNSFVAPGSITATTTITAGTGITSTTGNIVATAGQVNAGTTMTAGTGITSTTGNITATAGNVAAGAAVTAATTVTAGTGITSTTGNITATAGNVAAGAAVTATTTVTAGTGITSTTGNIAATAGNVTAGAAVSATTTVTGGTGVIATTGNVSATAGAVNAGTSMTATAGDITATLGNLVLNGAGKHISIHHGAVTDFVGTCTLSSGTVTVANTNIATGDIILFSRVSINGSTALGALTYTISNTANFIVTSVQLATPAVTETNDNSILSYMIVRPV